MFNDLQCLLKTFHDQNFNRCAGHRYGKYGRYGNHLGRHDQQAHILHAGALAGAWHRCLDVLPRGALVEERRKLRQPSQPRQPHQPTNGRPGSTNGRPVAAVVRWVRDSYLALELEVARSKKKIKLISCMDLEL